MNETVDLVSYRAERTEGSGESATRSRNCENNGWHFTAGMLIWSSQGLTFELSGPVRQVAGAAWCSITERTTQPLPPAVASPLERRVRPSVSLLPSMDLEGGHSKPTADPRDDASRCAALVWPQDACVGNTLKTATECATAGRSCAPKLTERSERRKADPKPT